MMLLQKIHWRLRFCYWIKNQAGKNTERRSSWQCPNLQYAVKDLIGGKLCPGFDIDSNDLT